MQSQPAAAEAAPPAWLATQPAASCTQQPPTLSQVLHLRASACRQAEAGCGPGQQPPFRQGPPQAAATARCAQGHPRCRHRAAPAPAACRRPRCRHPAAPAAAACCCPRCRYPAAPDAAACCCRPEQTACDCCCCGQLSSGAAGRWLELAEPAAPAAPAAHCWPAIGRQAHHAGGASGRQGGCRVLRTVAAVGQERLS